MRWRIKGTYWAPCSCKVGCPCSLGETEADQGWCSGALVFAIDSGQVDGVNVAGAKVALNGDWPSGFLAGKGTGRLYFDSPLPQKQREALAAVFTGQRGGVFGPIATLIDKVLPPKEAPISIKKGKDETHITVGTFGDLTVKPLRGSTGELTRLLHAAAGFRDDIVLAKGTGSRWHDPEMRRWESAGHAEQAEFDWKG